MSTYYKYIKSLGLCAVVALVVLGLVHISSVKAQSSNTPLFGWGWSSTIGHISFSSQNGGAGTGSTYGVVRASDGSLVGYAWSPNIGWIQFGNLDLTNVPILGGVDAKVTTNSVVGWARACAGTVNGDCTGASRTDGWDGWIEMSGTNHTMAYNPTTGIIDGFAWGSNVVGWLRMNLIASSTPTTTPQPLFCSISKAPLSSGSTYNISWSSNSNYCYGTSVPTGPFTVSSTSGNINIPTPSETTTYNLFCNKENGGQQFQCASTQISVGTGNTGDPGNPSVGTSGIKMWLDNNQSKESIRIKTGQDALINWKKNNTTDTYSLCSASIKNINSNNTTTFDDDDGWNTSEHNDGSPFVISALQSGIYHFKMSCTKASLENVDGKTTISALDYLVIRVANTTIEEI
jgi:hypothetical protein